MREVCYVAGALRRAIEVALALSLSSAGVAYAEPLGPEGHDGGVSWQVRLEPQPAQAGQEADMVFSAEIADGWILYSSDFKAELGPRPARFRFDPTDTTTLVGPVRAVRALHRKDRAFRMEYTYFEGRAEFRQHLQIRTRPALISGHIEGQACHEADGTCTLIHQEFHLRVE